MTKQQQQNQSTYHFQIGLSLRNSWLHAETLSCENNHQDTALSFEGNLGSRKTLWIGIKTRCLSYVKEIMLIKQTNYVDWHFLCRQHHARLLSSLSFNFPTILEMFYYLSLQINNAVKRIARMQTMTPLQSMTVVAVFGWYEESWGSFFFF